MVCEIFLKDSFSFDVIFKPGVDSSHDVFGWGEAGGIVYQKAYLELFCSRDRLMALISAISPLKKRIHLHATSCGEDADIFTIGTRSVTTLTWGVFPGREIMSPTIFEPQTFYVWAQEANELWFGTLLIDFRKFN